MLGHSNRNRWLYSTGRASIPWVGLICWMISWFLDEVAADQDEVPEALQTKELLAQTDLKWGRMLAVYSCITAC